MDVIDRLTAVAIAVEYESVPVRGDALARSDLRCNSNEVPDEHLLLGRDVVGRRDRGLRYHKHMRRRLWIDVAKCEHRLILIHDVGRYLAPDDLRENRLSHRCLHVDDGSWFEAG